MYEEYVRMLEDVSQPVASATLPLHVTQQHSATLRAASPSRGPASSSRYSTVRWGAQLIEKLPSLRSRKKSHPRVPRQDSVVEDEIKLHTINRKSIVGDRRSLVVGGSAVVVAPSPQDLPDEPGTGHIFKAEPSDGALRWCDICGEPIYSLLYHAVRCENCGYLCHEACRPGVGLDCPYPKAASVSPQATTPEDTSPTPTITPNGDVPVVTAATKNPASPDKHVQRWARRLHRSNTMYSPSDTETTSSQKQVIASHSTSTLPPKLRADDVKKRVLAYAEQNPISDFKMVATESTSSLGDAPSNPNEEAVFEGYLHVTLCLHRPISVANEVALDLSLGSINKNMSFERCKSEKRTTFYLPYGSVLAVRCRSSDKSLSVISSLLSKFAVADDSRKYVLFDDHVKNDIGHRRRINELEKPLYLSLLWGANSNHRFVLEENETSEIQWDCFTSQELNNFLEILAVEQTQQEDQIRYKYDREKAVLEEKIAIFSQAVVNATGQLLNGHVDDDDGFKTPAASPVERYETAQSDA
jgi:hypothetical protein